jgi:hypothetical protein
MPGNARHKRRFIARRALVACAQILPELHDGETLQRARCRLAAPINAVAIATAIADVVRCLALDAASLLRASCTTVTCGGGCGGGCGGSSGGIESDSSGSGGGISGGGGGVAGSNGRGGSGSRSGGGVGCSGVGSCNGGRDSGGVNGVSYSSRSHCRRRLCAQLVTVAQLDNVSVGRER